MKTNSKSRLIRRWVSVVDTRGHKHMECVWVTESPRSHVSHAA